MVQQKISNATGIELWAEVIGQGEPVLLIAGANASAMMWPNAFVQLIAEKGYRPIRYDHRDTGKSEQVDFESQPYSIADLCADAISILDGLGIAKAHVVGLSLGGTIGQILALDHPDRLLSITLMMTAALDVDFAGNWMRALQGEVTNDGLPTPRPEVVKAFQVPLSDRNAELDRRVAQWKLLSAAGTPFDATDYRAREEADIDHAGRIPAPFAHAMATPIALERGQELRRITVPTLVIQAMDDPLNPPPHGRHLADLIPSAKLVEIDTLGHALPTSHFLYLIELLAEHWKQADSALSP